MKKNKIAILFSLSLSLIFSSYTTLQAMTDQDANEYANEETFVYSVGDASFECSIDINDYIYEKNGYKWVDMPQMVEDAGYEVEPDWQNASNWSGRAICDVDGGVIIITLKKGTSQVDEKYKNVDIIATQLFPSREDNHALAKYYVTRESLENCDYRISKMTGYGVSLDQIKIAAYALSTAKWEGAQLNSEPFTGIGKNNSGFYLIP